LSSISNELAQEIDPWLEKTKVILD